MERDKSNKRIIGLAITILLVLPVSIMVFPHHAHAAAIPEASLGADFSKTMGAYGWVYLPRGITEVEVVDLRNGQRLRPARIHRPHADHNCREWRFVSKHGTTLADWVTCRPDLESFTTHRLLVQGWKS
jgi:hypothetical protein